MKKLRPTGGYRKLASFQTTTLIYDATVAFRTKFIDPYSRNTDQVVQAARSGRRNIAEGNRAGSTSTHSELKLTKVAPASQEELLLDFEDYLCQHNLPFWSKDATEAFQVRTMARQCQKQDPSDQKVSATHCQVYGKPMSIRTANTGPNQGLQFFGYRLSRL